MKYIVYLTINLENNKIYIGKHKCEDPYVFDGYIGCGVKITAPSTYNKPQCAFQAAVLKYGVKNFRRITLRVFDDEQSALMLEKKISNRRLYKTQRCVQRGYRWRSASNK